MKKIPQLYYESTGTGPVVILLHGYMASSRYWERMTEQLAQNHRVIAIDLLGFGKSPKPSRSRYDYVAQIQCIAATLASLDLKVPFTLVGHSMGSLISLRYAREYPEQIKKLLLVNMPVLLSKADAKDEILGTSRLYRIALKPGLHGIIWPIFKAAVQLKLVPERIGENPAARRAYMFQSTGVSRIRSMRNVIFSAKVEADLLSLHAKTVVISGLNDRKRYIQNLASLKLRDSVLISNVTGGHHLPLTQPELIAAHI